MLVLRFAPGYYETVSPVLQLPLIPSAASAPLGLGKLVGFHDDGVVHEAAAGGAEGEGVGACFQEGVGEGVLVAVVTAAAIGGAADAAVVRIGELGDCRAVEGGGDAAAAAGYGDGEIAVTRGSFIEVEVYGPGTGGLGVVPIGGGVAFADGVGESGGDLVDPIGAARLVAELEFAGHAVGFADLPEEIGVVGRIPVEGAEIECVAGDDDAVLGEGLGDGALGLPGVEGVGAGADVREGEIAVGVGFT